MMTSCGVVDRNVKFFTDEKEMLEEFATLVKVKFLKVVDLFQLIVLLLQQSGRTLLRQSS